MFSAETDKQVFRGDQIFCYIYFLISILGYMSNDMTAWRIYIHTFQGKLPRKTKLNYTKDESPCNG